MCGLRQFCFIQCIPEKPEVDNLLYGINLTDTILFCVDKGRLQLTREGGCLISKARVSRRDVNP